MPTYEYGCTACGNEWEQVQRITEPPVEVCPKCGKSAAHRLISATNFILKGGGWYSDLYSSAKPAEKKEPSGSASTESTKGDTKSDTKAEATAAAPDKAETKPSAPSSPPAATGSST